MDPDPQFMYRDKTKKKVTKDFHLKLYINFIDRYMYQDMELNWYHAGTVLKQMLKIPSNATTP